MAFLSPMAHKRFKAFRGNRRAWWSLIAFCAIFVASMCAELVCPCDPAAVTDAATLEPYRHVRIEEEHEVKTARGIVLPDGTVARWEGPREARTAPGWRVTETPRNGYVRVFCEPLEPPRVTSRREVREEISFPFRPVPGHPFGLDAAGRDVFARVVHGLRIALLFGLVLAFSGLVGGVLAGAAEGYFGGWTDIAGQRVTEIWSAMPFLYVMIFIGSTVGRSFGVLFACYALFNWITVSYYVRAEFLRLRGAQFVEAAVCQGLSSVRIVFRHMLPNALTPLVTLFPFLLMGAIGSLAALDFLGFGLPPMTPSLGELLAEAQQFRWAWWLVVFPGAALFVVMLLAVLVGEGLRDAFDPRRKSHLE